MFYCVNVCNEERDSRENAGIELERGDLAMKKIKHVWTTRTTREPGNEFFDL